MYDCMLEDLPCNSNFLGGWHNPIQANISCHHPSILKFLNVLRREQAVNEVKIIQHLVGQELSPKKRKYNDCLKRIKKMVEAYKEHNLWYYLKRIAYNLKF